MKHPKIHSVQHPHLEAMARPAAWDDHEWDMAFFHAAAIRAHEERTASDITEFQATVYLAIFCLLCLISIINICKYGHPAGQHAAYQAQHGAHHAAQQHAAQQHGAQHDHNE